MGLKDFIIELKNIFKWRTRKYLIDPFYILRWDFIPRLRRRNHFHVSSDMNFDIKIPVALLTYKRPWYFERTLKSFIEMNKPSRDRLVLIVLIQGEKDQATEKIVSKYNNQIDYLITPRINLGCAGGYNLLMTESLKLELPYIIHLQDDFISNESISNYIPEIIDIMHKKKNLGFIRLRSVKDKVKEYNVISRRKIKYCKVSNNIFLGNSHFTFNPTIARSSLIEKIIPTTSEKDAQQKYQELGLIAGQLYASCFSHIGEERVEDWIK
jgi:hypothetical protein